MKAFVFSSLQFFWFDNSVAVSISKEVKKRQRTCVILKKFKYKIHSQWDSQIVVNRIL